jgi:EthD domain-containing protein
MAGTNGPDRMTEQTHWRLALMFDASDGNLATLEERMTDSATAIRVASAPHPVRFGIADRHSDLIGTTEISEAVSHWRSVDGAIEVTVRNDQASDLSALCDALKSLLADLACSMLEVTAGPIFPMVPTRTGNAFLSLAFRRFPGTTSRQFRDWWRQQHSQIAIPVLSPQLLAYEQVHVDQAASRAAASAMGVPFVAYDAYDNLSWADREAFLLSCTHDLEGMARVRQDEVGRIDDTSRRHSLMREIG